MGEEVTYVLFSAQSGDIGALERLSQKGYNMAIADYDRRTALHIAASEGNVHVVRFLLEKCNVDPDVKDRQADFCMLNAIELFLYYYYFIDYYVYFTTTKKFNFLYDLQYDVYCLHAEFSLFMIVLLL